MAINYTPNYHQLAAYFDALEADPDRSMNVLAVGRSGSGKTFNIARPTICKLSANYFITDPEGTLLKSTGSVLADNGYSVKSFNIFNFTESMHYNPLKYVRTDTDILSFVDCLVMSTNGGGKAGDPLWENSERLLYTSLIALLRDWFPPEDYNLPGLLTLLSMAETREDDENFKSPLDLLFLQIEEGKRVVDDSSITVSWESSNFKRNYDGVRPADCGGLSSDEDFALMNYKNFKVAAGMALKSVIISCNVRLAPIAIPGVQELLEYDEMELDTLGDPDTKVAVFGNPSDTDSTFSFLLAIMTWQCIDQLCRKALTDYGGKLPTPVHFILDDFPWIGTIPQIEETMAVTRSRNISTTITLSSMSQLESKYGRKKTQTIVDCCDAIFPL